jgi:hypothetical protein
VACDGGQDATDHVGCRRGACALHASCMRPACAMHAQSHHMASVRSHPESAVHAPCMRHRGACVRSCSAAEVRDSTQESGWKHTPVRSMSSSVSPSNGSVRLSARNSLLKALLTARGSRAAERGGGGGRRSVTRCSGPSPMRLAAFVDCTFICTQTPRMCSERMAARIVEACSIGPAQSGLWWGGEHSDAHSCCVP